MLTMLCDLSLDGVTAINAHGLLKLNSTGQLAPSRTVIGTSPLFEGESIFCFAPHREGLPGLGQEEKTDLHPKPVFLE
jgi:hypothetical protein